MKIEKDAMVFLKEKGAEYIVISSNITSTRVASCCVDSVTPKLELVVDFGYGTLSLDKYKQLEFENIKVYIGLKAYELVGDNLIIKLQKGLFSKKLVVENFEEIDLTNIN